MYDLYWKCVKKSPISSSIWACVCVFRKMSRLRQQYILVQYDSSLLHLQHFAHVSSLTVCRVVPIGTIRKVKIASCPKFCFKCWSFEVCAPLLPVDWFIVAGVSKDCSKISKVKNFNKFAWRFGSKNGVVAIFQKGANCILVNMT